MKFISALRAFRGRVAPCALVLRLVCVVCLCASYLLTRVEGRRYEATAAFDATSAVESSLAQDSDSTVCDTLCVQDDAIVDSDRDNDPLLFLLAARAAGFFGQSDALDAQSALSGRRSSGASSCRSSTDQRQLARSAQLRC